MVSFQDKNGSQNQNFKSIPLDCPLMISSAKSIIKHTWNSDLYEWRAGTKTHVWLTPEFIPNFYIMPSSIMNKT